MKIKRKLKKERTGREVITLPEMKDGKRPPAKEVMILCQTNIAQLRTIQMKGQSSKEFLGSLIRLVSSYSV